MRSFSPLRWLALHIAPFIIVLICMNGLSKVVGLSTAAIVAALSLVVVISVGTGRLAARALNTDKQRLQKFTAGGIALGLIAGLVTMSATDLAGYDTVASYAGMAVAGIVIALAQSAAIRDGGAMWIIAVVSGWIIGAAVFREVAIRASLWYVFETRPLATVYESGHNELLWSGIGFAVQGVTTLLVLWRKRGVVPDTIVLEE